MDNLKKNPVAWAAISGVLYLVILAAFFFVLSLIRKDKTFIETISDPFMIALLVIGTIASVVQGYKKAQARLNGKEEKK